MSKSELHDWECEIEELSGNNADKMLDIAQDIYNTAFVRGRNSMTWEQTRWIAVSERLPKTDNKNSMNNYNVLLWVKDKNDPKDEPQVYLGKLRHIDGDDGSGNFWGVKTKPCDWTIWGWSYFREPEVLAWMPLPEPLVNEKMKDIVVERKKGNVND